MFNRTIILKSIMRRLVLNAFSANKNTIQKHPRCLNIFFKQYRHVFQDFEHVYLQCTGDAGGKYEYNLYHPKLGKGNIKTGHINYHVSYLFNK